MKSIAFLSAATHLGGAERSMLDLVSALERSPELGYSPWVILPRAEGPLVDELRRERVRHRVLEVPEKIFAISRSRPWEALTHGVAGGGEAALYLARLARLMRDEKPALLHSNGIKFHFVSALAGAASGMPALWHLRDILPVGPTLWALRAVRKASGAHIVANSQATAAAFAPDTDLQRDTISVIHNGLDPARYSARRHREFHAKLHAEESRPMVGIIGVLARWKGQSEFLDMAKRLVDAGSPALFAVIGGEIYDTGSDSGFGAELRAKAASLGLADRVLFTGFVKDPAHALGGLDVLVHASTRPEPFGRVIVEGMACGVPVVASAAGGVPEIVEDAVTGLLFEPGDSGKMAEAVNRILKDRELADGLRERASDAFQARFTSRRHVEAIGRLYDSIISAYSSPNDATMRFRE